MLSWRAWGRADNERQPAGVGRRSSEARSWPLLARTPRVLQALATPRQLQPSSRQEGSDRPETLSAAQAGASVASERASERVSGSRPEGLWRLPSFPLSTPRLRTALFSRPARSPSADGMAREQTGKLSARGESQSAVNHMLASSGWIGREDDTATWQQSARAERWEPAAAESLKPSSLEAPCVAAAADRCSEATQAHREQGDEACQGRRPMSPVATVTGHDSSAEHRHDHRASTATGSGKKPHENNRPLPERAPTAISGALYAAYDARERERKDPLVQQAAPSREAPADAETGDVDTSADMEQPDILEAGTEAAKGGDGVDSGGRDSRSARMRGRHGHLKLKHPNVLLREEKVAREESQASARKRVQESNSLSDMDKLLFWAQKKDATIRTEREQAAAAEHERKQRDKEKTAEEERQRKVLDEDQKRARRNQRVEEMLRASQAQTAEHGENAQKRDQAFRETLRHHRERANRRQPLDSTSPDDKIPRASGSRHRQSSTGGDRGGQGGAGGGEGGSGGGGGEGFADSAPRSGTGGEERERGKERGMGGGGGRGKRKGDEEEERKGKAGSSASSASSGQPKPPQARGGERKGPTEKREGGQDYESRYERFEAQAKTGVCLRYQDVPFPSTVILKDIVRKLDVATQRKIIKTWSRRWHPDTWARYTLEDTERGRIMDRVLEQSKEINALLRFYKE